MFEKEVSHSYKVTPPLFDLRETGQIEQDADVIMLMYREDYYDKETMQKEMTEIHVVKHRNGPVGRGEIVKRLEYYFAYKIKHKFSSVFTYALFFEYVPYFPIKKDRLSAVIHCSKSSWLRRTSRFTKTSCHT